MSSLIETLAEAQEKVNKAQEKWQAAKNAHASAYAAWKITKAAHTKGVCFLSYPHPLQINKRNQCQQDLNAKLASEWSKVVLHAGNITSYNTARVAAKANMLLVQERVDANTANSGTLAEQGLTVNAVETASLIEAEATQAAILIQANAAADSVAVTTLTEAEIMQADADKKRKIFLYGAIIVGVIALIIGLLIIKKLRNKKPKS